MLDVKRTTRIDLIVCLVIPGTASSPSGPAQYPSLAFLLLDSSGCSFLPGVSCHFLSFDTFHKIGVRRCLIDIKK